MGLVFIVVLDFLALKHGRQRGAALVGTSLVDNGRQEGTIVVTNAAAKDPSTTGRNDGALAIVVPTVRTLELGVLGTRVANGNLLFGPRQQGSLVIFREVTLVRGIERVGATRVGGARCGLTTSIHEILNRLAFGKGGHFVIRHNGLDGSPTFACFIVRHGTPSLRGLTLLIAHVDGATRASGRLDRIWDWRVCRGVVAFIQGGIEGFSQA